MVRSPYLSSLLLLLACLLLAAPVLFACGGGSSTAPAVTPPVEPPPEPPVEPPPDPPTPWPPLDPLAPTRLVVDGRFATSPLCSNCHSNADLADAMRDDQDRPVAPMDLWRAGAMAAAARDPYWRAVVSREVETNPTLKDAIESKCITCHSPMAHIEATEEGGMLSMEILTLDTDRAQIALDGVSCTFCHQLVEEGLGDEANFSGGFVVTDDRLAYAGHPSPWTMPMYNQSGYTATASAHLRGSDACAACHTLFTHSFDEDGESTGDTLTEQSPYLEWLNSVFNDEVAEPHEDAASCQDCHTPSVSEDGVPILTAIARQPGGDDFGQRAAPVRDTYSRHVFTGANASLAEWLKDNAQALQPNASPEALDVVAAAARAMLGTQTADLSVRDSGREGDDLLFVVRVENRAGHKFPTAYPSRRAWLRVRLKSAAGEVIFASGEHDEEGRLLAPDGTVLSSENAGGPYQHHYAEINAATQVQIYQPVMADHDGALTFGLLRGSSYLKDNRLLPRGWDPSHAEAARCGPTGDALLDANFVGGRDDVRYRVLAPASAGPYTVEADLLYQTVSPRHAAELFTVDTQEIAAFRLIYEAGKRTPDPVAHVEQALP